MDLQAVQQLMDQAMTDGSPVAARHHLLGSSALEGDIGLAAGAGDGPGDFDLLILLEREDGDSLEAAAALRDAAEGQARTLLSGPFSADAAPLVDLQRPLRPGTSISVAGQRSAGTLGGFVRLTDGRVGMLSNAHVLSPGANGTVGNGVCQPGGLDDGNEVVASVTVSLPMRGDVVRPIDAAAAALADGVEFDLRILVLDEPLTGTANPIPLTEVAKVGRTTGLTRGTVLGIDARVPMEYDGHRVHLRGLMLTEGSGGRFSMPGDSGSIVYGQQNRVAYGLHVGSNQAERDRLPLALAHPIEDVLAGLGAQLVI